jgi:hypothetical protein
MENAFLYEYLRHVKEDLEYFKETKKEIKPVNKIMMLYNKNCHPILKDFDI